MRTIDRYILRELLGSFGAALTILLLASLSGVLVDLISKIARGKVPAGLLLSQLGLRLVDAMPLVLPLALFVGVLLGYSRLLRQGRLTRIRALASTLANLDNLQSEHDLASDGLARERAAAERERAQLLAAVAEREAALDAIRRELHDQRQRLAALGRDERQLMQLLERLRDIFADLPATLAGSEPFARRRGQLAWPADGRAERSGDGLRIVGNEGDPVRAIGYGRVAYADWLRGYGLLLILDHGDGYMSLYGHNEALLVAEGSWVQDGQAIARIGRSGGETRAGLYFELRERGRSVDPQRWLRRR